MLITRVKLENWRNFQHVDVPLREQVYVLGANATGKSNFLDVFRFLRDICRTQGGGLQKAVADRGGIGKLRCLHARRNNEVRIEVDLANDVDDLVPEWRYVLAFKPEGKGKQRTLISDERVFRRGEIILERPRDEDNDDPARRTQTHLEQIQANANFREVTDFLARTTYLHLVPQLLKYAHQIGGQRLEGDPFGQGFLERVARTSERIRTARLKRIEAALKHAVPQFSEIRFIKDEISGHPHLEALYAHYRPKAGWQREEDFSDGTLRLIALLWSLLDGDSLLLLEEPELSLNDAVVKEIPLIINRVQKDKRHRQIFISTHSEALLSNPGIDGRGVLRLEPGAEGSVIRTLDDGESAALRSGLSVAEVVLPKTRTSGVDQLSLW